MSFSSASSASNLETVQAIMVAKTLGKIIGQHTTKTMNTMTEQMAKMVAAVKTTTWGGGGTPTHGSLTLVLNKDDYRKVTRDSSATIDWLPKPALVSKSFTSSSITFKILSVQESQKAKKAA